MKKTSSAVLMGMTLILLGSAGLQPVAAQDEQISGWERPVYEVMMNADALRDSGQYAEAKKQYDKALKMWYDLYKRYPGLKDEAIKKRAAYCHLQAQAMEQRISAGTETPPEAPATMAPSPVAAAAGYTREQLVEAIRVLHRKNKALEKQINRKEEHYVDLTDTAMTSASERAQLKQQNRDLQAALEDEKEANENYKMIIARQQDATRGGAEAESELKKKLDELASLKAKARELEEIKSRQIKAARDHEQEIQRLNSTIQKLEQDLAAADAMKAAAVEEARKVCEDEKQVLRAQCREEKEAVRQTAEQSRASLQQERDQLQEQLVTMKQEMEKIREQAVMQTIVEPLLDEPLTDARGEPLTRDELESQVRKLSFRIESMKRYENMLKKENIHLLQQLSPIKTEKQKAEQNLSDLVARSETLETQVSELRQENERMKKQLEQIGVDTERYARKKNEQIQLKDLLKTLEKEKREVQSERDELRLRVGEMERRIALLQKQADDCRDALMQAEKERDAANRKAVDLQKEIQATSELLNTFK